MPEGLIETAAQAETPEDQRFYGLFVAQVINNIDKTGQARVQVRLPWLPGFDPWARVAVPLAGNNRGTYFIPQEQDEVLVAFNHGDIRDAYIIGSLWNARDRPPAPNPRDAANKFVIKTPRGQVIEIDDLNRSITITSVSRHQVIIEPEKIEISTTDNKAVLTLDQKGNISLKADQSIKLEAPSISISGKQVEIRTETRTSITGGGSCDIQAGRVNIN